MSEDPKRIVPSWILALALYLLVAIATIGRHAIGHLHSVCACVGTEDPAAYMWALSWWPHALGHGLNPFVTHYEWAPTGVNTAQAAMIPTAAVLMAPVTAVFGVIFSYNVLSIASPVLAAFTAYLLCRRLVKRELPAIAGGYLFGFSSYVFAQLTGHLNLTLIFLIPIMVHLSLRRVDREISRAKYVVALALVLVLQAGLSTELLVGCVVFGILTMVCARVWAPGPQRSRVDGLLLETIAAGALALAVGAPFFYYALFSGKFPKGAPGLSDVYGLDLVNPVFPTLTSWLGHHDFLSLGLSYETGHITEADGYLSIPFIAAFAAWVASARRTRPLARTLMTMALITFVLALGSHLHVAGYETVALPFNLIGGLPVVNNLLPSRLVIFTVLAMAIGVAAWLAEPVRLSIGRWGVVLLAVVLLIPNTIATLYGVAPRNPSFFATTSYTRYLKRGDTVLVLPFGHNDVSTLWQAETGFYFYMPEGYVSGVVPQPFESEATTQQLLNNVPPAPAALEAFVHQHRVSYVVVDASLAGPWPAELAQLRWTGRSVAGVLLYSVPGAP